MLRSIEDERRGFSKAAFDGVSPSPVQVREMRKAFFAGAAVILAAAREVGGPHVSEEAGVLYFEGRWQELLQFQRDAMRQASELN